MIRKLLLSTVAIAAVTPAAFAADLPSRRAPPVYVPPPPAFTWTGFYIGADVGYGFGQDNVTVTGVGPATGPAVALVNGPLSGIVGGIHVGYNFSTQSIPVLGAAAGAFSGLPFIGGFGGAGGVGGVEADGRGSDLKHVDTLPGVLGATALSTRGSITGTFRGRIGIAVDRALFFATGGVAITDFSNAYTSPLFAGGFQAQSNTRIGYVVGGGVEYAITTNFSLRAEYRYEDFGKFTQSPAFAAGAPAVALFTNREIIQQATFGFSYKFENPVAPVVARY